MPTDPTERILAGYTAAAPELRVAFDVLKTVDVLAPVLDLIPRRPTRVLDIGAGTGRDAIWLAQQGHDVTAIEPVRAL